MEVNYIGASYHIVKYLSVSVPEGHYEDTSEKTFKAWGALKVSFSRNNNVFSLFSMQAKDFISRRGIVDNPLHHRTKTRAWGVPVMGRPDWPSSNHLYEVTIFLECSQHMRITLRMNIDDPNQRYIQRLHASRTSLITDCYIHSTCKGYAQIIHLHIFKFKLHSLFSSTYWLERLSANLTSQLFLLCIRSLNSSLSSIITNSSTNYDSAEKNNYYF